MNKIFFDRSTVNIIACSLLSFIEAMQVLIIICLIFSFIPIPIPAFAQKLYPLSQYDVRLERESFFYHIWIAAGLMLQGILVFFNRRRMGDDNLGRSCLPYLCTMGAIVYVQIFVIFKIFLWGNPWWARDLLYVFIGLGILARIFWPECWRLMNLAWGRCSSRNIPSWGYLLMDAAVILILTFLIFTPDLNKVLARMFSYDRFYHFDSIIMSPGWAHHQGMTLSQDVTSEYSIMIPIVFDSLMKVAGGFSYLHALVIVIVFSAIYYLLLYGLWRYWIKSFWLAFFAVILCIKLQFFHWGVLPLIWIYPSATPLRTLPDVFFLFFILRFTQSLNLRWLLAAAIVSGLTLIWIIDVGSYMYMTLTVAAAAVIYQKGIKVIPKALALILFPWCIALGVLHIFYGGLIGESGFWHKTFEFAALFLQGWGALPITDGLNDKQFFALCMAFVVFIVYVASLLYSLAVFVFRQSRPHLFMVLICIYGLGLEHYYIHRSAVTSYYSVVVPLIFVLLFWTKNLLSLFGENGQKAIKLFLCLWAMTALMTCFLFTYYPNFLNLSGYDWSGELKYYEQNFDFDRDAVLIDDFTSVHEAVPLISSFETKILMQANRRPFFYYFPLVGSQHMYERQKMNGTYLHTYGRLDLTLKQLQDKQPPHIFIQTNLYEWTSGPEFENSHSGLKQLLVYIHQHYQFLAQGQYLTALRLK